MTEKPKNTIAYSKPPLIEALIDIQVSNQQENIFDKLVLLASKFADEYPNRENLTSKKYEIKPFDDSIGVTNISTGLRLSTLDKKHIVQIKDTGLTVSIVNGYNGWEELNKQAKNLWKQYIEALSPLAITRVAVRYINRIDIPFLRFELEDYFKVYPKVFDDVDLSGFFVQLQFPQKQGGTAIIHEAVTTPASPGSTSILLDLDIFDNCNFKPSDNKVWERFEILREQKNLLFENCLTDKAKALFI